MRERRDVRGRNSSRLRISKNGCRRDCDGRLGLRRLRVFRRHHHEPALPRRRRVPLTRRRPEHHHHREGDPDLARRVPRRLRGGGPRRRERRHGHSSSLGPLRSLRERHLRRRRLRTVDSLRPGGPARHLRRHRRPRLPGRRRRHRRRPGRRPGTLRTQLRAESTDGRRDRRRRLVLRLRVSHRRKRRRPDLDDEVPERRLATGFAGGGRPNGRRRFDAERHLQVDLLGRRRGRRPLPPGRLRRDARRILWDFDADAGPDPSAGS
mmetsp:Transcript_28917/g.93224  ORF Transcript_28917/g.93224 Transcript_28917/m.93224 type:complete len:265 (+) Transcript_28917:249-1043(+)